jgi:hypothetical protein
LLLLCTVRFWSYVPNRVHTGTASRNLQADLEFQTQQKVVTHTVKNKSTIKLSIRVSICDFLSALESSSNKQHRYRQVGYKY